MVVLLGFTMIHLPFDSTSLMPSSRGAEGCAIQRSSPAGGPNPEYPKLSQMQRVRPSGEIGAPVTRPASEQVWKNSG